GSGQKDCHQSAYRDHSSGIKAGSCRRKSTLRKHSCDPSDQWAQLSCFPYHFLGSLLSFVLQILHYQIRKEEKRHQPECVRNRMHKNMPDQFCHKHLHSALQASFHIHTNYPLSQGHLQTQVSLTIEGNINLKKAQESKSL